MAAHVSVSRADSKLGTVKPTSVSPNVEHGIELIRFTQEATQLLRVLPQRLLLAEELRRLVVLGSLHRTLIQWCSTALGRGDCQIGLAFELVVRMGELGQVPMPTQSDANSDFASSLPSCLLSSVAQLVVRAENDEDFWCHCW